MNTKLFIILLLGLLFTLSFAASTIENCAEDNTSGGDDSEEGAEGDDNTDEGDEADEGDEGDEADEEGAEGAEGEEEEEEAGAGALRRRLAASCTKCNSGYRLTGNAGARTCEKCTIDNCDECGTAKALCDACKLGFGFDDDTKKKCVACATDCKDCGDDAKVCDKCKDGYANENAEGEVNDECSLCANGCKTCDNIEDSCSDCASGRVKNNTDTKNVFCCPTNCTACSDPSKCTACIEGNTLDADKGTCSFGFKSGAGLTLGAIVSVALFSLLF